MNIKIENAWGEDGEIMTLYCNNQKIKSITLRAGFCETLLDYLIEFNVGPNEISGVTAHTPGVEKEENFESNGTLIWII